MRTHDDGLPVVVTELTIEQHRTRAELLGLWYDRKDNTYNRLVPHGEGADLNDYSMIDAITLLPITPQESSNRRKRHSSGAGRFE